VLSVGSAKFPRVKLIFCYESRVTQRSDSFHIASRPRRRAALRRFDAARLERGRWIRGSFLSNYVWRHGTADHG
jgi:hypothetical protein